MEIITESEKNRRERLHREWIDMLLYENNIKTEYVFEVEVVFDMKKESEDETV